MKMPFSSQSGSRGVESRALVLNLDFRDVVYSFQWERAVTAAILRRGLVVDTVTVHPFAGRDLAIELGVERSELAPQGSGTTTYVERADHAHERAIVDRHFQQHRYQIVVLNCSGQLFAHLVAEHREYLQPYPVRVYDRHLHLDLQDPSLASRLEGTLADWGHLHIYSIEEIASPGILTSRQMRESQDNDATFLGAFRRLGLHPHHLHFQQWPLDDAFFAPRASGTPAKDFVLFSGGDSGRDYGTLFAAIEDLPVQLRLCANQYPSRVPKNVTILPRLPLHRFRDEIAGASLVVVPLTGHPPVSGITVVAMAKMLGKAVIASDNAIVRLQIPSQGNGGYLAQAGNPTLLRTLIRALLDSPQERERLECEGRQQAARDLSLQYFAEHMSV